MISHKDIIVIPRAAQKFFSGDSGLTNFSVEGFAAIQLVDTDGRVFGLLALFFAQELEDIVLMESIMRISANRIMATMDRINADCQIAEQTSLLDQARDAIFVCAADSTIRYWSAGAERVYGFAAGEVVGKRVDDIFSEKSPVYAQAKAVVLEQGEWTGEIQQKDGHGSEQVIESRWSLVRNEGGGAESIVVISTDVTEHRHLEQQFIRAQRLESIGTMAGGLAHDLNNMLAPISMAAELLKSRVFDERGQELIHTISESAKRGARMIEQVIAFSRGIESKRQEVHPKQLVSEIVKIGRDTFFKDVFCQLKTSNDLWTVSGDSTQLHQVLLNLCINARDAIEEGGKVVVRASNVQADENFCSAILEANPGPYVCISVEDNGSGISPELLEKIFDPFFTTKEVGKGTGLGLPTSMAIVRSHGGFIQVKSKVGEGTTFRVYLPAQFPPAAMSEQARISPILHGHGELILIVDDEESILQITQQALETYGYRALLAHHGKEAVEIYTRHCEEIAVVILNMMMPVLSGPATIDALAKLNPAVNIVAVSGIASSEKTAMESSCAVKRFLAKPYTAERLLNILTELTNNDRRALPSI